MAVPTGLPAPRQNVTRAGFAGSADDVVAADTLMVVGDYTGGAADDLLTLASHGLTTGDYVFLLWKSAPGVITGAVGTKFRVKVLSSSTFQVRGMDGVLVEHSADGSALFLKGSHATPDTVIQNVILPRLIVATGDFTGGTTDDEFIPTAATGMAGLEDTNTLKLLYKAAAGVVVGINVNTIVFAKSVRSSGATTDGFELAATSGGADIENSADGVAVFIKTS